MTNEELALLAQKGDKASIEQLWQQVQRLTYQIAWGFFHKNADRCGGAGVTLDDLKQECFLAMLDAVKGYDSEKGFLFTSFLHFPIKNRLNALAGLRTNRQQKEPLNAAVSLDAPLPGADNEDLTLLDALEDTDTHFIEDTERSDLQRVVREAVKELPPFLRFMIDGRYFRELTYDALALESGCTREVVRSQLQKAMQQLRKNPRIRSLSPYYERHIKLSAYSHDPLEVMLWG